MKKTLITSALAAYTLGVGVEARASLLQEQSGASQAGKASYYADSFNGRRTASGARYDRNALSAAHRTLPLGTQVRVTDVGSGDSVVVQINDRGPFARGRVIDLSRAAASEIGLTRKGVAEVRLDVLNRSQSQSLTLADLF
ncbi:septal ring lytic transglycosylase RlpA family protein [uncultured Thiodictyon sp.]|uniref:septal ring lytic transglycosylase RlpA family protein n=1 Tax=uncultured Thiodictyon sp. TaxID=1846217 RepID=UPI0025ECA76B|nr:septal ring lytic transglycosylase RlpA family protein [uncultured Thiodictyon sp.]